MINTVTTNMAFGPPHFVDLHVNSGESVSIQFIDGNEVLLRGPNTIQMVSNNYYPPVPLPVQVPPGHMIEQIVDENGTLKHIVLSALGDGAESCGDTTSANYMPPTLSFLPFYSCGCYESTSSPYPSSSAITPPQQSQQQQQQQPVVAHLSNTSTGVNGQATSSSTLVSMASQSIPCSLFPATYVRQRRPNRNFAGSTSTSSKKIPTPYGLSQPSSHGSSNTAAWNNKMGQPTGVAAATTTTSSTGATTSRHRSNEMSGKAGGSRYEVSRGQHYEALPPLFEGNFYLTKLNESFNLAMKKPGLMHSAAAVPAPLAYPQPVHHHHEGGENVKLFKSDTLLLEAKKYENYVKKACSLKHAINSYCLKCQHKANENSMLMIDNETMIGHKSADKNRGGEAKRSTLIEKTGREDAGRKGGGRKREARQVNTETTTKSVYTNTSPRGSKEGSVGGGSGSSRSKRRSVSSTNDSKPSSVSEQTEDASGDDHQTDGGGGGGSPETVPLVVVPAEKAKNVVRNGVLKSNANGIVRDSNKVIEPIEVSAISNNNKPTTTMVAEAKDAGKAEDKKQKEKPKEERKEEKAEDEDEETEEEEEGEEQEEEEDEESEDLSEQDGHEKEEEEEEDEDHAATRRAYKHLMLPKIEAIAVSATGISFNYVRLRWQLKKTIAESGGGGGDEKRNFIVDMLLPSQADGGEPESRIVYQGCNMSCRVSHLRPQSSYTFRVRTITSDAVLVSNLLEVVTTADQSANATGKQFGRKSKQQLQQQVLQQQQQIMAQQLLLRQQQQQQQQQQQAGQRRSAVAGEDRSGASSMPLNQDTSIWSSIQRSEKQCAMLIIFVFTLAAVFGPAAYHFLVN